jgi:DNA mismatch repair ATPase MutS
MLRAEFDDDYLGRIDGYLAELKFRNGLLLSAGLGAGNAGTNYVLRRPDDKAPGLLQRMLGKGPPAYTFRIPDRDIAGAQALGEIRSRGINLVANAMAQSMDHILGFFETLRAELAFYIGALNLHAKLQAVGMPTTLPQPSPAGSGTRRADGLYDPCLALGMGGAVVGNALVADRKPLLVVTGANQGGKSSFLRGLGLAQLMMQSGLFVAAESFAAEPCRGLFTHYKREEDKGMTSGKLDEELGRLSSIVDAIAPGALLLLNESFASTNELEGSEIARQIVAALRERGIRVCFVTHLYAFAHGLFEEGRPDTLFLRAERRADGTRTFRLVEGEPLETSYGVDLYREVFGSGDG